MSAAAPKRNVLLAIAHATGDLFCVTFADNTERHVAEFRRHAAWWKGWVGTRDGRERMRRAGKYPCAPFRTVVEPYDDGERPPSLGD